MAGPRGYHNYRGRNSKGKTVLAVVLVLVILAALGFLALQRYIIYDETGRLYLELPWQKDQEPEKVPEEQEQLELTIQEPEQTRRVTTAWLAAEKPVTQAALTASVSAHSLTSEVAYNAVAVTVKDAGGLLYFDTAVPAGASFVRTSADTAAALGSITGENSSLYSVARLSCFHDSKASNADVEGMGLKNTGGYIFYDGHNTQWLDPGKEKARQYLCELARDLAEQGFDEILLTDVSYPTEGKLDKIDYGETMKAQNLRTFLEEMGRTLEPYGVTLSIELPEAVVLEGSDNVAGLTLADIVPLVDRICAVTTAEKADQLRTAVEALSPETEFVPELTAPAAGWEGSSLILE